MVVHKNIVAAVAVAPQVQVVVDAVLLDGEVAVDFFHVFYELPDHLYAHLHQLVLLGPTRKIILHRMERMSPQLLNHFGHRSLGLVQRVPLNDIIFFLHVNPPIVRELPKPGIKLLKINQLRQGLQVLFEEAVHFGAPFNIDLAILANNPLIIKEPNILKNERKGRRRFKSILNDKLLKLQPRHRLLAVCGRKGLPAAALGMLLRGRGHAPYLHHPPALLKIEAVQLVEKCFETMLNMTVSHMDTRLHNFFSGRIVGGPSIMTLLGHFKSILVLMNVLVHYF